MATGDGRRPHTSAGAGSEALDHNVGVRPGDGGGFAQAAAAVAGLAGLQVALVVLVELDLAAGGDLDPLFDTLVGFELGHEGASSNFHRKCRDGRHRGALRGT